MRKLFIVTLFLLGCEVDQQSEVITVDQSPSELQTHVQTEALLETPVNDALQVYPSLVFSDYHDDCWYKAVLNNGDILRPVLHPSITCFESYSEEDVSPNHHASLLHALTRGVIENGVDVTSVEKYACYFIDLRSGNISDAYSDSICGGEWSEENSWVVDEDERYIIAELF